MLTSLYANVVYQNAQLILELQFYTQESMESRIKVSVELIKSSRLQFSKFVL